MGRDAGCTNSDELGETDAGSGSQRSAVRHDISQNGDSARQSFAIKRLTRSQN